MQQAINGVAPFGPQLFAPYYTSPLLEKYSYHYQLIFWQQTADPTADSTFDPGQ